MCLHIVSRSSFESTALAECLQVFQSDDALLLTGSGVLSIGDASLQLPATCWVLAEDFELRFGGQAEASSFRLVDYSGWIDLCIQHGQTLSWY